MMISILIYIYIYIYIFQFKKQLIIPIKIWYGTTDLETTEIRPRNNRNKTDDDFDPNRFKTYPDNDSGPN